MRNTCPSCSNVHWGRSSTNAAEEKEEEGEEFHKHSRREGGRGRETERERERERESEINGSVPLYTPYIKYMLFHRVGLDKGLCETPKPQIKTSIGFLPPALKDRDSPIHLSSTQRATLNPHHCHLSRGEVFYMCATRLGRGVGGC